MDDSVASLADAIKQLESEIAQINERIIESQKTSVIIRQELSLALTNCLSIQQINSALKASLPVF